MASRSDIKAGAAFVELFTKDAALVKGLQSAQKRLTAFGGNVKSIGMSFATMGAAVTAPFAGLLGWGVKLSAEAEQASVAFGVLLGSETKAATMLAEIKKFANTTPFDEAGLKSAAQLLLNFGITGEGVMPTLRMLGDVAGGDAEKLSHLALAFGQMSSTGRLMGQDLNQMINAGFNPLQEISRTTGKSMAELKTKMEAGGISVGMVTDAFASATAKGGRFYGMMDKQSRTLTGVWSTMKDALAGVLLSLADPLLPLLKQAATFTTGLLEAVKKLNLQSGMLTKVVVGILAVGAGITAIGGLLVGAGVAISAIGTACGAAAVTLGLVGTAIGYIVSPLGLVTVALGAGVFAWARYTSRGQAAMTFIGARLGEMFAYVKTVFGGISDAISAGDLSLAANIGLTAVLVVFEKFKLQAMKIWFAVRNTLTKGWQEVSIAIQGSIAFIGKAITGLLDQLVPGWQGAWKLMATTAVSFWNTFRDTAMGAITAVKVGIDVVLSKLKLIFKGLQEAVKVAIILKPQIQKEANDELTKFLGVDVGKVFGDAAGAAKNTTDKARQNALADDIIQSFEDSGKESEQEKVIAAREAELAALIKEAADLKAKAAEAGAGGGAGGLPAAAAAAAKASSFGSFSGAALGANSQGGPIAALVDIAKKALEIDKLSLEKDDMMIKKLEKLLAAS